jgi:hypothetical protein
MGTYNGEKTMLGQLVTWAFVALLALAAIKLAFWVFGAALGLGMMAMMLIFRLAPIILVGWLVVKLIRYLSRPSGYPEA